MLDVETPLSDILHLGHTKNNMIKPLFSVKIPLCLSLLRMLQDVSSSVSKICNTAKNNYLNIYNMFAKNMIAKNTFAVKIFSQKNIESVC
ncbi:hypothetical protein NIES2101_28200 [Calothrix sp. HK-06]|nr:hypothetical protein NIES2101_28200 [Calothrix sp. HK-06]